MRHCNLATSRGAVRHHNARILFTGSTAIVMPVSTMLTVERSTVSTILAHVPSETVPRIVFLEARREEIIVRRLEMLITQQVVREKQHVEMDENVAPLPVVLDNYACSSLRMPIAGRQNT